MQKVKVVFEFDLPDDADPVDSVAYLIHSIFEEGESIEDYANIEIDRPLT